MRHGYRVLEANGPTQGLDIGQGHEGKIDLLLTDVIMPGMNGIQLAHRLAEIRPGMKVLCMSGYADETALQRGLSDANIAFLQKPLTPDSLSRKVREVLNAG
jgi:DNA-binding NtrC family response regulator